MLKRLKKYSDLGYSLIAIILAFAIGALLIYLSGLNVGKAYSALFNGAFGSLFNFTQTLMNTIPLIFTGLAVAIGFKSGLFNIGGEGQMYLGAFVTAITAIYLSFLPSIILIPLVLLAGGLAGSAWSFIPGYLKTRTGAHEVVTTIMMNYIGILATSFLLLRYFQETGPIPQTVFIPESARLPELIEFSRLTWAIFIAVFVVILCDIFYKRTNLGYKIQTVGKNSSAAEYAGISSDKMMVLSMMISGFMAGLAGATIVMGVLHRFITNFSPGYGFTGIAVAVLGRNKPVGVLFAALLFGALQTGGITMQLFAKIPMDLMVVIQGLVILFVATPVLIKKLLRK
jgi:simple sugar transport system permease protein